MSDGGPPSVYEPVWLGGTPPVPPTPPPLPRSTPARTIAWIGVLGSPAVVLVLLLVQVSVPTVIGWLIIAAFIGGFGYLVATMDREPRDPWDDGSRV